MVKLLEMHGQKRSLSEWSRIYNIPRNTLLNRLKRMSLAEAVHYKSRTRDGSVTAFGRTETMATWSKLYGVNRGTIHTRLRAGWSPEDAVSKPVRKRPTYKGKEANVSALAREHGISRSTVKKRVRNGLPLELALTLPVEQKK